MNSRERKRFRAIPEKIVCRRVFRMARERSIANSLRRQIFDPKGRAEMATLLQSRNIPDLPERLLDGPFQPKTRLRKKRYATRFSDGSFPVFYCSLEPATAEAEIKHWIAKMGRPGRPRTVWYLLFSCNFYGVVRDVRPMRALWPQLAHDSDYGFCNALGAEAVKAGLDALLAPSARKTEGTNLPVFARASIGDPERRALVAVTYDPSTGAMSVAER